jgi:membrane-associated phospholipid phosphatase
MEYSHQPETTIDRTHIMASRQIGHRHALQGRIVSPRLSAWLLVILCLLISVPGECETVLRDLSDAEEAAILGGSAGILILGRFIKSRHDEPVIGNGYQSNALDQWVRNRIHGGKDTTTNFLDNHLGSAVTPLLAVTALTVMDIKRDEFGRDIPFFLAGVAATKGITDVAKRLVGRPRPYCLDGGCPPPELGEDDPFHQRSFFSGHTSSAFFSATFLNKRFRRHMRQNWTRDEYRTGRVLSPILAFGWASVVGMSRIHADRHFFTDVAAGALAGALMAELYYHLAYESDGAPPEDETASRRAPMLVLSFPIN